MPDAKPILTFGMPIYHEEHFVEEALESLWGQTRRDRSLGIAYSASTEGAEEICQRFAARDARISDERRQVRKGARLNITAKSVVPAWMQAHVDFMRMHWGILVEPRHPRSPAPQVRLKTQAALILSRLLLVMSWLGEEVRRRRPVALGKSLLSM